MTLKEIAKIAGVSTSTVSRVVNGNNPKAASPEIREKIWAVVRDTGYTPNESAQNLKTKISERETPSLKKIYCIFARTVDSYLDPFFTELMQAIEQEAFSKKYTMRTVFSLQELQNSEIRRNAPRFGALVLGRMSQQTMDTLSAQFKHIAYVGLNTLPYKIDQIVSDGYTAARSSVEHLFHTGHSKILYVGEIDHEQRYHGYVDAMKTAGVEDVTALTFPTSLTPHGGYSAANRILDSGIEFTAIFCANDDTAMGSIKALKERGISIPNDVSVIGVGDIELARYFSPMLSTVHIPIRELGQQAAKTIIDRIENNHHLPMKIELPSSLIIRESSRSL